MKRCHKACFLSPRSSTIAATKEEERRKRKSEEKRKKAMVALLVFIIATLETVFVVFSRQTLLDAKGPFGDDVFKNPVRTTRAIMALANYHHLGLLY